MTAPIALHVAAKRYLCAVEEGYVAALSPSSMRSLELQGGPMTDAEIEAFERLPHHAEATQLRRWDDAAKVRSLTVAALTVAALTVPALTVAALSDHRSVLAGLVAAR